MKYLLDTCTVSDFVKGEVGVLAAVKRTSPQQITISVVTLMEIEYGLLLSPLKSIAGPLPRRLNPLGGPDAQRQDWGLVDRAPKLSPLIDAFIAPIQVLTFDVADAKAAASIRATLRQQGRPIGPYDCQIAACALARGLVLVSSNEGEFRRVGGLQLENWRAR